MTARHSARAAERRCCASSSDDGPYAGSIDLGNMIMGATRRHLALQASYDIAFPTFAMLSICNAAGLRMRMPTEFGSGYYPTNPLTEAVVAIPEILIERPDVDVPTVVRPMLNMLWNAFEMPQCDLYTPQGVWKGTG